MMGISTPLIGILMNTQHAFLFRFGIFVVALAVLGAWVSSFNPFAGLAIVFTALPFSILGGTRSLQHRCIPAAGLSFASLFLAIMIMENRLPTLNEAQAAPVTTTTVAMSQAN